MLDFKKEFPVLTKYTYLNTAYSGLMHQSLTAWRRRHDLDYLEGGSLYRENHHNFTEQVRASVGGFFNCNTECVSLVPNFSFAFNTLLAGLGSRRKVLLLNNDYPSVNLPFQRGDFEICYAAINENLEDNIGKAVARHKPDILALSIVQYINGIKIDLSFLKKLKEAYPKLMIIADGTQFCGTEFFDFENSGIDIIGASAYKWMLAGYGNGFMLFKKEIIPELFGVAFTKNNTKQFSTYQTHLMNYFEPGHLDSLSFGSLLYAIQFLTSAGQEKIASKINMLSSKAKQKLSELGLLEKVVLQRDNHSGIFNIKGDFTLFNHLKANNILCSQRGNGIRVAFHFYNSEKDLNVLVSHLKK
jgi:selenocysteine lyase/cysteine desulfurase